MPRKYTTDIFSFFDEKSFTNRVFGLDILRAVAIISVMVGHGQFLWPERFYRLHGIITLDGVTFFFVLSGFLIGRILIKELETKKISGGLLLNFWIRRWARTLPTYLLILTILGVLYNICDPNFRWSVFAPYYIFMQNFAWPIGNFFRESWSLSVEEWFYLSVPALIFALVLFLKLRVRSAVAICAAIIILAVTALRFHIYQTGETEEFTHIVIYRLDSIMYGVLGAYLSNFHKEAWQKKRKLLMISGIAIILIQKAAEVSGFYQPYGWYDVVVRLSTVSLGTLLTLPFLSSFRISVHTFFTKAVTAISLISYSMYLTHMSLTKDFIIKKIPWTAFTHSYKIIMPANYLLYWGITICASALLYKYYELPTTRLRDKFGSTKNI